MDLTPKQVKISESQGLSEVDIIVPYHGQYNRLSSLLQSLWSNSTNYQGRYAYTQSVEFNLCLVDDASPQRHFLDEIQRKKYPGVTCLRNKERMGFGFSLQQGFQATKSPWVVFLNSDVVLKDIKWLASLGETYRTLQDQNVKMVSSRMDRVPCGDPRCRGEHLAHGNDVVLTPSGISELVDQEMYLPFVCVLAERSLFEKIGFIKPYPLGYYEDLEFACRMSKRGFKQAISGKSFVQHEGGATFKAVLEIENQAQKSIDENFQRCCRDIQLLNG